MKWMYPNSKYKIIVVNKLKWNLGIWNDVLLHNSKRAVLEIFNIMNQINIMVGFHFFMISVCVANFDSAP